MSGYRCCGAPEPICSTSLATLPIARTSSKPNATSPTCSLPFNGWSSSSSYAALSPDPPYLRALAGSHAIFYRVTDDGEVLIARVLHAAMLPELHLDEPDQ